MFREIPTSNRLLQKKWQDKNQEIHIRKLKEVRSCLNIWKPVKPVVKRVKDSKKEKIQEERFKEIERANNILLQKMKRIMEGSISKHSPFEKGSLNKASRRKHLVNITIANHALLRRLQEKKSNYDVMKWEQDRVHNEKMAKWIGRFSSTMTDTRQSKSSATLPVLKNPRVTTTRMNKRRIKKNYETDINTLNLEGPGNKKRAHTTHRKHKRTITIGKIQDDNPNNLDLIKICKLPEEREVLYQGSKSILSWSFEIEISKTIEKMYIAAVNRFKHSEFYVIDLESTKGDQILQEFNNDFDQISTNLQIISRRLVLLNPKLAEEAKKYKNIKTKGKHLTKKPNSSASHRVLNPKFDKENDQNALNAVEPVNNKGSDEAFPAQENKNKDLVKDDSPDGEITSSS
jgi:hypothetical protein